MTKAVGIDDILRATAGEGRIITGYVVIAEAVTPNDEYEIVTLTDGTSSPWKLEGLVSYALNNGYVYSGTDDVEDEGDE